MDAVEKVVQEERVISRKGKRGQTLTEYAIIIALIVLVCIGVVAALGDRIAQVFTDVDTALEGEGVGTGAP